jgi:hypothetical protein
LGGIVAGAIALVVFGFLGFLILKGIRWFGAASVRSQSRVFEDLTVFQSPAPGLVGVVFHTYSGLLVFVQQVEYRFWATPDDARTILARMNKYNLTRGFFAYGALVIPLLSIGNYWAQKRRIVQQEAAIRPAE